MIDDTREGRPVETEVPVTYPPSPWHLLWQVTWSRSQLTSKQALSAAVCQGPCPVLQELPAEQGSQMLVKKCSVSRAEGRIPSRWGVSEPSQCEQDLRK